MSTTIIGIVLILLGVLAIMFMPQGSKKPLADGQDSSNKSTEASAGEPSEEEAKQKQEAEAQNRQKVLSNLVAPGNAPPLRIYFGSQTGTAEKYANALDEEAHTIGWEDTKVIDFNDFNEEEFPKQALVIVCVATHYEGDPCDNTRSFFKWMKAKLKKKAEQPFKGMNFSIFGLGDTSYEQFNEMGRVFDESFEKLGGSRFHDMAVGNAETFSTEDDFNKWKSDIWSKLIDLYAKSESPEQKKKALLRRRSSMKPSDPSILPWIVDDSGIQLAENTDDQQPEYDMNMRNYIASKELPIKSVRQLRQQCLEGGSTIEVVYDLRGSGLTYKTAANSAIYATNRQADVERFAKMFELDLDRKFEFRKNPEYSGRKAKTPFPIQDSEGMSFREALTKHIDLQGAVSKKVLTAMIQLCEAKEDKEKLEEVTKSGSTLYEELFRKNGLGLIDILTVVPSLRLTANFIFQVCEKIMPRYYTIASSSLAHPEDLTIAISLSRYQVNLPDGAQTRDGLVSGYLEDIANEWLAKDGKMEVSTLCFVKESNFVMPNSHDVPILMVGPGTGLVPFIGFMQEREKARTDSGNELALGPAHLYFGCRRHDVDFIYRDEMHQMKDQGIISELNCAFSRPVEEGAQKAYVQDVLAKHRELIRQVMAEQNGEFFVCGATNMGKAVETLLKETLGEEVYKNVQKEKRYKVELWAA